MRARDDADSLDQATREFMAARPHLFGIAYRVLGSVVEAEDIVQDAWLRWQNTNRADIVEPGAFLATVTSRLAINLAQSAPKRRESYIGPWLPEPVDTRVDPQLGAERAEALDLAVLHLMEKLNPVERAAYVLREAFDYPYKQIADMLETSEANTRQLVSRARKHLSAERKEPVSPAAHRRLLEVFLSAAQTGNLSVLEDVLTEDVVSYSDGGGIRGASKIPVVDVLMSPNTSPPSPHASGLRRTFAGWRPTACRPSLSRPMDTALLCCASMCRSAASNASCGS